MSKKSIHPLGCVTLFVLDERQGTPWTSDHLIAELTCGLTATTLDSNYIYFIVYSYILQLALFYIIYYHYNNCQ